MLVSIFGVAFSASFNTLSLVASLANEHGMLSKSFGKKNKHDGNPLDSGPVNRLFNPELPFLGFLHGTSFVYSVYAFYLSGC